MQTYFNNRFKEIGGKILRNGSTALANFNNGKF